MNYENFLEKIKEQIEAYYDEDTQVFIHKVIKNNNLEMDGLSILPKDQHLSPAVYLNDYYQMYLDGKNFDDIIDDILSVFDDSPPNIPFQIEDFKDFSKVKHHIVYKLINFNANKKLLQTTPFHRILDLALVFYVIFPTEGLESATILIQKEHLHLWNISHDTLFQIAKENTPRILKPQLKKMSDLIEEFVLEEYPNSEEALRKFIPNPADDEAIPMYVLTNHLRLNGSAVFLYDGILEAFSQKYDMDIFILPSSIHEVILVPANGMIGKEALRRMVKEVNAQEVAKQEQLSNQVYIFCRKTHIVTM